MPQPTEPTAEQVAQLFQDTFDRLARESGYTVGPFAGTVEPWSRLPQRRQELLTAAAAEVKTVLLAWYDRAYGEALATARAQAKPDDDTPTALQTLAGVRLPNNGEWTNLPGTPYQVTTYATDPAGSFWLRLNPARSHLETDRDEQIRALGRMLLAATKPAGGAHCCDVISNAWGHSAACVNTPPFLHPDDRG